MDLVLVADVCRFIIVFCTLLLVFGVVRLLRLRGARSDTFVVLVPSYLLMCVVIVIRRLSALGDPADVFLVLTTVAVMLGLAGVLGRLRFNASPPWHHTR